ncbi:MAG: hypothetical protein HY791_09140 [Deltaproteobacteria bacterium]|nr:hypothetical protein [Deltaproteobacteria bacterium]
MRSSRPLWILADCHAGVNLEADRGLLELLDRAERAGAELLVLGDLFTAWLGVDRFITKSQGRVLGAFARIRASGGRVRFVVGNRDYFAEDQLGIAFDELIVTEAVLNLGGRQTLVTHGDLIRSDDVAYRRWRALSRARATEAAVRRLPARLAQELTTRLESALSKTNQAYKSGPLPISDLEAFGRRALLLGAERALLGHFHTDQTISVPDGAPVVIAPAWIEQRRVLVVDHEGAFRSVAAPGGSRSS